MDESDHPTSFFTQHIYGDEARPGSTTGATMFRTAIDPIVHYRADNSRSSSPRPDSNHSADPRYQKGTTGNSSPPSAAKHAGVKLPFSPLLPKSPKQFYQMEDTYSRASHFTKSTKTSNRLRPASAVPPDSIQFYSLQEGLDWDTKVSRGDTEGRGPRLLRQGFPYPTSMRENVRHYPRTRMHNSLTSLNQLTRDNIKSDEPDHYRSVLYVIAGDSPNSKHKPRSTRNNRMLPTGRLLTDVTRLDRPLDLDHYYFPPNRSLRLRRYQPFSQSYLFCTDLHPARYRTNVPHIAFQGSGRYIEERPLTHSASLTRQAFRESSKGASNPIYSSHSTDRLHLIRGDSHRVIVDIKPRVVSEADKHQNTSQWIQVGTLGDANKNHTQFSATQPHCPLQNGANSKCLSEHPNEHSKSEYRQVIVSEVIEEEKVIDSASMRRRGDSIWRQEKAAEKPTCISEVETICDQPATPTGTATNSVRSNITVNIGPCTSEQYYAQNLQRPSSTAHVKEFTLNEDGGEALISDYELPDEKLITAHSTPNEFDALHPPEKAEFRANKHPVALNSDSERRNTAEGKIRPEVAPKPTPREQLAAILEKPTTETSSLKFKQGNDGKSSSDARSVCSHGTLLRSAQNVLKASDHPSLGNSKLEDEVSSGTPVSKVRSLTAFFTDLIRKQNEPFNTDSSGRQLSSDTTDLIDPSARNTPLHSSPYLLHEESPEERERRLKAVENLRKRSTATPPVDYSKHGVKPMHGSENHSLDDPHQYARPTSTPRPRYKYMTTNVTRSNTPLSTNGSP